MQRVLCSAIVDPSNGHSPNVWVVTVTGEPPHDVKRTYEIAGEKGQAAMTGINRFVAEMSEGVT